MTKFVAYDSEAMSLVVLLDVTASAWSEREATTGGAAAMLRGATLTTAMEALLVYMNAYLLLDERNTLSVLGWGLGRRCAVLYPRHGAEEASRSMEEVVMCGLRALQEEGDGDAAASASGGGAQFSAALSRALCQHNRRIHGGSGSGEVEGAAAGGSGNAGAAAVAAAESAASALPGRILAVQVAADDAAEYVQVMNCIFCAKKMNVVIDSCVLGRRESSLLQQASSLTGGLNLRVPVDRQRHPVLLGTLLANFLPDATLRASALTELHPSKKVSQKAVCFATHKPVAIASVCSVCLAVFDRTAASAMSACASCGTAIAR